MRRTLLVLLGLWAAPLHAEELAKLTVGTVLPLTGPQAAFGKEATKGLELALDVLKQRDPELAARVTIASGDDQSNPKDAAVAADKLLEKDRAHILIGSVTAATTTAVIQAGKRKQTPVIAEITTQGAVQVGDGSFRACAGDALEGRILAEVALTILGAKQAATLREDSPQSVAFTDAFTTAFKAGGGTVTTQETYDLTAEDFTPALKKIQGTGAKLVVTPAPYHAAALILTQAKKLDEGMHFLGGDSWDTPSLNKAAGPAAAGHYFVAHFAADDPDPATQAFVKAFQQKYGRAPGALAALSYDAASLAFDAFKRARTSLKGPLTSAIAQTQGFAGAAGLILAFDQGEAVKALVVKETTADGAKFKARVAPRGTPAVAVDPKAPQPAKGH